jgi:uncharacterized protein (DUF58 family)
MDLTLPTSTIRRIATKVSSSAVSPCGAVLFILIAGGLCAAVITDRALPPLYGAAALFVLGLVWPYVATIGLCAEWTFHTRRIRELDTAIAVLRLRNYAPWSIAESRLSGMDEASGDTAVEYVPMFGRVEQELLVTPRRRGLFPPRESCIANGFPFGLATARRRLLAPTPIIVWPRTFSLPLPKSLLNAGAGVHEYLALRPGNDGETIGIRGFQRNDSPRRVHWPQTARQGQLVVREQQNRAAARILVVLDVFSQTDAGNSRDLTEWAIRCVASAFESWARQGAEVDLEWPGSARHGSRSEKTRSQALDALALLDADRVSGPATNRPPQKYDLRVAITTASPHSQRFANRGGDAAMNIVLHHSGTPLPEEKLRIRPPRASRSQAVIAHFTADDSLPLRLAELCRELADA